LDNRPCLSIAFYKSRNAIPVVLRAMKRKTYILAAYRTRNSIRTVSNSIPTPPAAEPPPAAKPLRPSTYTAFFGQKRGSQLVGNSLSTRKQVTTT
jgi:hypothetical protein